MALIIFRREPLARTRYYRYTRAGVPVFGAKAYAARLSLRDLNVVLRHLEILCGGNCELGVIERSERLARRMRD